MSDGLSIHQFSVGPLQVNCFLVACLKTLDAMVVDPGDEGSRILALAEREGVTISKVVNTHCHFDHIGANRTVVDATGASLMLHAADLPLLQHARRHAEVYGLTVQPSPEPDRLLEHGDTFTVGDHTFRVFHVPGHSPGSICLLGDGHLFVGDVLFAGSIGRTDLPGGDFNLLVNGARKHLFSLPDATVVHPGHGPDTTIGRERRYNPFVGDDACR
jgi:glyoxylase-like metal-dependent hydrolase (beta-lactamase superfamily II)